MGEQPPLSFARDTATLRDVIRVIEDGAVSAAFAVDADRHLVGIVTDGDVRRALLGGASLDDPVAPIVVSSPLVVGPRDSRATALDMMRGRLVAQLPIVDDEGCLVGVHTLHSLVGGRLREHIPAVILAGGRGTRLQPMSANVPKPMVTVAGRPILERLVLHLAGFGITDIVLAVGHLSGPIEAHFADGAALGVRIRYVRDPVDVALGTCGPVAAIAAFEDFADVDALVVMNGDLITDLDVAALVDDHLVRRPALTMATRSLPFRLPYAMVTQAEGVVSRVEEKPILDHEVNLGVYVMDPRCLSLIPPQRHYDMTDLVADLLAAGETVRAWQSDEDWLDVGTPTDLGTARGIGSG